MAFGDSADLLSRVKVLAARDKLSSDASMTDANWYSLLSAAQLGVYGDVCAHIPWLIVGAPTLLTSADSGETYTFASSATPMYVELYDAKAGRLMRPGAYHDSTADYVWEGDTIRFPLGKTKTFSSGPYARMVTPPTIIDGSTEPTLPLALRLLLVPYTVALWAERGGMRDAGPYWATYQADAFGNHQVGRIGMIYALKLQNPWYGAGALSGMSVVSGLDAINTGSGYQVI